MHGSMNIKSKAPIPVNQDDELFHKLIVVDDAQRTLY